MTRRAWLLAAAAILVRAVASLTVVVIDADGARDLRMAELIREGRFSEALTVEPAAPPLHPYLLALLGMATRRPLAAGVALSAVLGGLSVLPLYSLARRGWDDRVATVSSFLYMFLPAVVDAQIEPMTEATFMFLFFSALALAWKALEELSWEGVVAAAGCATLAWLTRPEGIYLLPLFGAAAVLRRRSWALAAVPLFLATGFVVAWPYLSFIHAHTGRWDPSLSPIPRAIWQALGGARSPAGPLQDYDEYRVVARHGRWLGGALHLGANFFGKVLFYVLGPFLLLGLARPGAPPGGRSVRAWTLLAAGGYLVPVALSFAAATPFSHRFLLVPASLVLPWAAAGLVRASERIPGRPALAAGVGALCLALAARDLRPRREDKVGFKEAGEAILRTLGPGARVWTTNRQVEFYARSRYAPWPEGAPARDLVRSDYDAFAVCPEELPHWEPGLEDRIRSSCRFLGEFPSPARPGALPVRVYCSAPRGAPGGRP